jgi:deoxyribodipyrimidine photolyase-related protein
VLLLMSKEMHGGTAPSRREGAFEHPTIRSSARVPGRQCHAHQERPALENLRELRSSVCVAQEVGAVLGRGAHLQRSMPRRSSTTRRAPPSRSAVMGFREQIQPHAPDATAGTTQRWIYVPYDQLDATRSLAAAAVPRETVLVFVESREKARRRPYHRQKLALLLSSQRHFALEMAERGFSIAFHGGDGSFGAGLERVRDKHGVRRMEVMRPAERELRVDLEEARARGLVLDEVPNTLWLTSRDDFDEVFPTGAPFRMDAFYRHVRRQTKVLMDRGKPVGGKFSFDADNRQAYRGAPPAPRTPRFEPDAITREVLDLVATRFPHAFGSLEGFAWPCTAKDVELAWSHALEHGLPLFGPFEDAMCEREPDLFHTRVSPLVNLGRLTPARIVGDALRAYDAGRVPLASAEGFVRQVLGWREFVKHVHDATDGFRAIDPSASPNALDAREPLPPVFWGQHPSGLRCLDGVAKHVHDHGWSHHITRLMVLSNLATLLGVSPRELTDWFWVAYVDAYDWVVEPNVLGMGTFADGGVMTTKPYVSGAAYLQKMGDACRSCRFDPSGKDPERACPVTPLYWDFLRRNEPRLLGVERLTMPLASMRKRSAAQAEHADRVRERVLTALRAGEEISPHVVSLAAKVEPSLS